MGTPWGWLDGDTHEILFERIPCLYSYVQIGTPVLNYSVLMKSTKSGKVLIWGQLGNFLR